MLLRGSPAVRLRQTPGTSSRWTRSCRYWEAVLLQRAKYELKIGAVNEVSLGLLLVERSY